MRVELKRMGQLWSDILLCDDSRGTCHEQRTDQISDEEPLIFLLQVSQRLGSKSLLSEPTIKLMVRNGHEWYLRACEKCQCDNEKKKYNYG